MKLNQAQERINELFSNFVTQVRGATAMSRTDINRVSEVVLVPIFSKIFGFSDLRNLNYTEHFNYPGIDLADSEAKVAIQVTSTSDSEKVKDTLTKFVRNELHKKYTRLIVYNLIEKQSSYSGKGFAEIIDGKFTFDKDRDILDYRDVLRVVSSLQIDQVRKVEQLLEGNFGNGTAPFFHEPTEEPTEVVHLNLLEASFPRMLFQAKLAVNRAEVVVNSAGFKTRLSMDSSWREVAQAALEQLGLRFSVDWECHEGQIITFRDLNDTTLPLAQIIDQKTVTSLEPHRYFTSNNTIDVNRERVFKSLLRRCLQQKLYPLGVQWQAAARLFIFTEPNGAAIRKEQSFGRNKDERTVYERHMKPSKPDQISYCKHFAFRAAFKRIGEQWYVLIRPDWFFSYDGYRRSFYSDERLSGLKRLENQQSVFNHFRFIEHFLKTRMGITVDSEGVEREYMYPFLSFDRRVAFDNAPRLEDKYWNPKKSKGKAKDPRRGKAKASRVA